MGKRLTSNVNQWFKTWCDEKGFGDIERHDRAAAMWFVQNLHAVEGALMALEQTVPTSHLTHPRWIKEWFTKYMANVSMPDSLRDLTITEKPTITLDQRSAEKLAKVINRAQSGDEGSETAKRHVESIAKKHGVTVGELREVGITMSCIPSPPFPVAPYPNYYGQLLAFRSWYSEAHR